MQLRLQYAPIPENASKHAQIAVDAAWNVEHRKLDFSAESLAHVDAIVGGFHRDGARSDAIMMLVFCFGCYIGEIFVRHHGAVWKMPEESRLPDFLKEDNNMMFVECPNGDAWNPIGKTFKLHENGELDSVAYFYHVATKKEH